jgi:hypothetical protein
MGILNSVSRGVFKKEKRKQFSDLKRKFDIPAKAGILTFIWIPDFSGITKEIYQNAKQIRKKGHLKLFAEKTGNR